MMNRISRKLPPTDNRSRGKLTKLRRSLARAGSNPPYGSHGSKKETPLSSAFVGNPIMLRTVEEHECISAEMALR